MEKKEGLRRNSRENVPDKDRLTKSSRRKVVGKKIMRGRGEMGRKERVTGRCRKKEGRKGEIERYRKDVGGREGGRNSWEVGGKEILMGLETRGNGREGDTEGELCGRWEGRRD